MKAKAATATRLRSAWAALGAAALLAACGGGGGAGSETPPVAAAAGLATAQPGELRAYVQDRLRQRSGTAGAADGTQATFMPAPALAAPAASPSPASPGTAAFSGALLQETGVDEPDLLATDGALGRKVGVFCSEGLDALGRETAAVREDLREGLAGLHETPTGFL